MRGLIGMAAAALALSTDLTYTHHTRRGRKSNCYPVGRRYGHAPFASEADAARAVRRAKRWLRNRSAGRDHVPPAHIRVNAEVAVAQFGQQLAD